MKEKDSKISHFEAKMKELENKLAAIHSKSKETPDSKVDNLLKCESCDFKTSSKQGLKTHIKRKHTTYETYPRKCDLCDNNLDSKEAHDKHMTSHSYKPSTHLTFKREECEFWGPNKMTMEVHIGKHHSVKF